VRCYGWEARFARGAMGEPGQGDKLLPGEAAAITSGDRLDVEHWVKVYSELFGFKTALMRELTAQRGRVDPDGQPEVQADEQIFKREADRLERRLLFWQDRASKV
jgi:hypothetical protein